MQISIITATFNAANHLPQLIDSLRAQTLKDFEWIVADGDSTDGTLEILSAVKDLNLIVSSQPDFGIYDALNRAIKQINSDYYVVIGADDVFLPNALNNFVTSFKNGSALATAPILINGKPKQLSPLPICLIGYKARLYGHSGGTAFKKSLHYKYGFYSKKYPIAADYDFMVKVILGNEEISYIKEASAHFGMSGVSNADKLGCFTEVLRVNVSHHSGLPLQILIFLLRTSKYYFLEKFLWFWPR